MASEAFVPNRVEPRCAMSLSLVSFDANPYSVPTESAHHGVKVIAAVDTAHRRQLSLGGGPPPVLGP
jgi:hypothetical protein